LPFFELLSIIFLKSEKIVSLRLCIFCRPIFLENQKRNFFMKNPGFPHHNCQNFRSWPGKKSLQSLNLPDLGTKSSLNLFPTFWYAYHGAYVDNSCTLFMYKYGSYRRGHLYTLFRFWGELEVRFESSANGFPLP